MPGDIKFRKSGIHNPNALEILQEVQPINFAKQSPLKRLDFLLGTIKKHRPEVVSGFVANLQQRYESLVPSDLLSEQSIDVPSLLEEYDVLKDFPKLASGNLNYFLYILQPPESTDLENDRIEISQRTQLRSVLCPKYQNLLTLTETIDRNEAFEIYKNYHDALVQENRTSQEDRFKTLEEFANQWNQESAKDNPGLIRFISEVKDGKFYLKKKNCLWNDAISDLQDREVKYMICCYGDFDGARRANKHFVLTMERTIIEGHSYCDSAFHDTRIDDVLTHPPDEFFENIIPE